MGSPQGAPIPLQKGYGQTVYQKDHQGKIVVSKLDQTMLQEIAASGGGVFIRATNTQTGLNKLFERINKMEKKEMEERIYTDFEHRFQYLLAIALFFILLDIFVPERKSRWLKDFNLFKINSQL